MEKLILIENSVKPIKGKTEVRKIDVVKENKEKEEETDGTTASN